MKKKIVLILTLLSICMLFACINRHYNEWITKDGKEYYYNEKGIMLKNCYSKIGSDTYAFDEAGALIKERVVNLDGKPSFVDSDGKLKYYGWCSSNGNWYFANQSVLQTGWIKDQGNWYYLDYDGVMQRNRWVEGKYFVDNDGKMVVNRTITISGKTYIFDSQGIGKEKPDYELIVDKYPNPIWAQDCYVQINSLNIELNSILGSTAYIDYIFDGTILNYIYSNSNSVALYYKVYDDNNYLVSSDEIWIETGSTDMKRGKNIKKKGTDSIGINKDKGIYRVVFYNYKNPY